MSVKKMNLVSKHAPQHDQSGSRRPIPDETSVSETIRKPPLVKAQTAFLKRKKRKYGEKRFSIWRTEFLHPAMCGTIMTLITPGDCTLQCGMWFGNHDSEFTKWQHPAM